MSKLMRLCFAVVALLLLAFTSVRAEVRMSGEFEASRTCPALQSIKKKTNPGDVTLVIGTSYRLLAKNKDNATHFRIDIPGASPSQRWVAIDCGSVNAAGEAKVQKPDGSKPDASFHILAVSWQPAFCEGLPNKPECKSQTADRFDASHFTLHGLWPQPRSNVFCNVTEADKLASENRRWFELPEVKLSNATRASLDRVMPGTQSALERHEWIKHGTCYGAGDMEGYYSNSVRLMEELNVSAGAAFMAANVGKSVSAADLRAAFDQGLGAGAGDRMRFACKRDGDRDLLVEITIGLNGTPWTGTTLKDLIMAASPTDPGCPQFVVDPVGLQ
jgi:ribonuclease T2